MEGPPVCRAHNAYRKLPNAGLPDTQEEGRGGRLGLEWEHAGRQSPQGVRLKDARGVWCEWSWVDLQLVVRHVGEARRLSR